MSDEKIKVTIKDVAVRAGVSLGTVSNYLNGKVRVSKKTSEKIEKAIKELNYVPDLVASSLRRKDSKEIYILIPDIKNTFYTEIISEFSSYAKSYGFIIYTVYFGQKAEHEKEKLDRLMTAKEGTYIIIFNGYDDEKEIKNLIDSGKNIILADRGDRIAGASNIEFDNQRVMYDIADLVKERGYQTIMFFSGLTEKMYNIRQRKRNLIKAFESRNLEIDEKDICITGECCSDALGAGYKQMQYMLQNREEKDYPDCILATSDYLAIGLLRACYDLGYRVPEDFAILGFDDITLSDYSYPRLTTVRQDQKMFAEKLWNIVENIYKNGSQEEHIELAQKLIIRESC